MELLKWEETQIAAVGEAMFAVVSARGQLKPSALEIESIDAMVHFLMNGSTDSIDRSGQSCSLSTSLFPDRAHRLQAVQMAMILPFVDGQVHADKAAVVEEIAANLGVEDDCLDILRRAVVDKYGRVARSIMKHGVGDYLKRPGVSKWRAWMQIFQAAAPRLTPPNRARAERYRALSDLPEGTMGRALFEHYTTNKFSFPGEYRAFPEMMVPHEFYHIVSGYPASSLYGEMLTAAFTGGNVDKHPIDYVMMGLLQFHVGKSVAGPFNPTRTGFLKPHDYFQAVARGASMSVMLATWDWWPDIEKPLETFRAEHGLLQLKSA